MMVQELTKLASGVVGNNQPVGTVVATISNPGKGHWRLWGYCRHAQADSLRLKIGSNDIIPRIPSSAADLIHFGPVVIEITNTVDDIVLDLAVETGDVGSASGIVYAEMVAP